MGISALRLGTRNDDGIKAMSEELRAQFGERFQTGEAIRAQHCHTTTWVPSQ